MSVPAAPAAAPSAPAGDDITDDEFESLLDRVPPADPAAMDGFMDETAYQALIG
mgnify:CR=1 FL=1